MLMKEPNIISTIRLLVPDKCHIPVWRDTSVWANFLYLEQGIVIDCIWIGVDGMSDARQTSGVGSPHERWSEYFVVSRAIDA